MGNERKRSGEYTLGRLRHPVEDRETLLTCPACGGEGKLYKEHRVGQYRIVSCNWCEGAGAVSRRMEQVFRRWRHILAANIKAGTCQH